VVIISTSILSMEAVRRTLLRTCSPSTHAPVHITLRAERSRRAQVLASFPAQRLRRNTLVVDVLSVKARRLPSPPPLRPRR
jgi:hypothetical protein